MCFDKSNIKFSVIKENKQNNEDTRADQDEKIIIRNFLEFSTYRALMCHFEQTKFDPYILKRNSYILIKYISDL